MHGIVSKLAAIATVMLLVAAALLGVAWLRESIPDAALPDALLPIAGRSPPIELATIPWKRNPAHPTVFPQPIAVGGLAWMSSTDHPGPVNLTAIAVPWTSNTVLPVNLTVGATPWSNQKPSDNRSAVVIQPAVLPWPIDKK